MTKVSAECHMYVISLLKNGDSIAYSSRTTGIIRPVIRQCWHYYLQGGTAQVFHTNCAYTTGFKQQVLETKWQNGLSFYRKASLLYNVLPHTTDSVQAKRHEPCEIQNSCLTDSLVM